MSPLCPQLALTKHLLKSSSKCFLGGQIQQFPLLFGLFPASIIPKTYPRHPPDASFDCKPVGKNSSFHCGWGYFRQAFGLQDVGYLSHPLTQVILQMLPSIANRWAQIAVFSAVCWHRPPTQYPLKSYSKCSSGAAKS